MLFRVGIALLVSVVLIGGATWVRTSQGKQAPTLFGVEGTKSEDANPYSNAYWPEQSLTQNEGNLTKTDLISRQLMGDFITLSTQGEATEENISKLVNNYVEIIPTISSSITITVSDLKTVPNTRQNFLDYDRISTIIAKARASSISNAYKYSTTGGGSGAFYSLAGEIGKAYEKAAEEHRSQNVPLALAEAHVRLINNYYSTAAGMKSISQVDTDSAGALAGMVNVSKTMKEEEQIVSEIISILTKNGL